MKGATLFGGFEGVGLAMEAVGIEHVWSVENDPDIAAVARENGFNVVVADVLDCDPKDFKRVDVLHASPPCPNFSVAKANGEESERDKDLARQISRFVEVLKPRVFTLENVYLYRRSASWEIIRNALYGCGYWFDLEHINAADFGVPQTRKRMIVRAIRGAFVPYLPAPEPWRGWYGAIEDLIPGLPDSEFADWQKERLAGEPRTALFSQGISRDANGDDYGIAMLREGNEPALTVTANHNMSGVRAFLVSGGQGDLIGGKKYVTQRNADDPAFTVTASEARRPTRAWLAHGRTVQMTPRALARFQSFPDSYALPEKKTLACRGVGNACPPLLMQKLYESLLEQHSWPLSY